MRAPETTQNLDYVLGILDALRAQVKQMNRTIAALEGGLNPRTPSTLKPQLPAARPTVTYALLGQVFPARSGNDILVSVFRHFAELDPDFPGRFKKRLLAELAKAPKSSKRGYVGRTPQELYPGSPSLWKYAEEFAPGWLIGTNESNEKKLTLMRLACRVMDLRWGCDLKVSMP
jgi:hypothetical protein